MIALGRPLFLFILVLVVLISGCINTSYYIMSFTPSDSVCGDDQEEGDEEAILIDFRTGKRLITRRMMEGRICGRHGRQFSFGSGPLRERPGSEPYPPFEPGMPVP